MPLTPGTQLGSLEIVSLVGTGGMGEVYKAKDLKLGREVAVKVLREELATDPERLKRFEQEARAASALNHPNIITVYDIGKEASTSYIAMELAEGRSLRGLLAEGPIPGRKLLELATQIAEGLAKAHAAGIVHRDLKPENLMVTEDGFVKILDFGLAKLVAREPLEGSQLTTAAVGTQAGIIMGTVGYMSPEQAKALPVDYRSDQFSLGLILYEMASGAPAFRRETAAQTMTAILESEPAPLGERTPQVPPGLEGLVSRLLSKDRVERYDSTKDLAKDLKGLRDALIASVTSGSLKASSSNRSSRWAWWVAPLLVAVIAASWWGLERGREPAERPAGELGVEGDVSVNESESAHVIAVLPFENIAADPAQDYFSAGMTEEVSGQLAKLASLQVMSRAAIGSGGDVQDLSRLADELGVGSVVTGSVRQTPERVRINVQLVDARTKRTLWSEQYDRALEDIFEVQSDVALQIADALEATLSPGEKQRIEQRPTESLAAYELYLRSLEAGRFTTEGLLRSVSLLEQAVELDPGFALAYARMARQLFFLSNYDDSDYWEPGLEAALKAVELDPELSWGHSALGDLYALTGRLSEAKLSYLRAIDLNPSDTVALNDHSWAELLLGNYDESLYWSKRALPFNPNSPNFHSHVAWSLLALGDDAITERWLTAAEESLPYYHRIQVGLALLDMLRSRDETAIARLRRAAERAPENVELNQWRTGFSVIARADDAAELVEAQFRITPEARMSIGMAPSFRTLYGYVLLRRREEAEAGQLLEQALAHCQEELAQGKDLPWIPMEIASIHALRGETEAALERSERAYDAGFRDYRLLQRMPLFDSIRDEARFGELLSRMETDVAEMRRRAAERGLLDFDEH